jgi:hypothetical protein
MMIIVKLQGGLGNQMFQYALGRELQRRNGGRLALDLILLLDRFPRSDVIFRNYDLDIFRIQPQLTLLSKLAQWLPVPLLYSCGSAALNRLRNQLGTQQYIMGPVPFRKEVLEARGNIYLDGHWQSPKYFAGSEDVLRHEFAVKQPLSPAGKRVAVQMASVDSICVNVRRTDFVTLPASIKTHGFVGQEYYMRGIEQIAPLLKNPHIFVTSDDVGWCRENLHFDYPTTVLGHEYQGYKFGEYLTLMAQCKHFLIPNSSFAWWAVWLNRSDDKMVVCPKNWYRDPKIDSSDLIPPQWTRI